jgi:predicted DsbA family dithiol-disulfide isomerase
MHNLLFQNRHALDDEDLLAYAAPLGIPPEWAASALLSHTFAERVREDFMSGVRSGVNGTPTFFINGVRHDGPWDEPPLLQALHVAAMESADRVSCERSEENSFPRNPRATSWTTIASACARRQISSRW